MKQKDIVKYGIATLAAITAVILIRRYFGRKKITRIKQQEMDPKEKVADVQTNFENNTNGENW